MRMLAVPLVVFVTLAPAQQTVLDPAEPQPFPKSAAKWSIRGKARGDALLASKIETRQGNVPAAASTMNPVELTLPHVVVWVEGLERRWRFAGEEREEPHVLVVAEDAIEPPALAVLHPAGVYLRNELAQARHVQLQGYVMTGIAPLPPLADHEIRPSKPDTIVLSLPPKRQASGILFVMPNPIFALTDAAGRFELPPLPDGEYEVVAYHALLGRRARSVRIDGRRPRPLTFVFEVPEQYVAEESQRRRPATPAEAERGATRSEGGRRK